VSQKEQRLRAAQLAATAAGLDALLIPPSADLQYLTGYDAHALERLTLLVLPADGEPTLIVPAWSAPRPRPPTPTACGSSTTSTAPTPTSS